MKSSSNVIDLPETTKTSTGALSYYQPSQRRKKAIVVAASVIAVAAIILVGRGASLGQKSKPEPRPAKAPVLTVTTSIPSIRSLDQELSVHGTISAWDPISVGATAGGLEIKSINVEEGALVKKEQILAILDSAQLQAQLDSEKARLASSVANVSKSIQPNRQEDINGLDAAVAQAQANVHDADAALVQAQENFSNAEINVKRYKELRAEGAVSAQECENRETTARINEAAVRSAKERVRAAIFALKQYQERMSMARVGGRREDIQIAKANVAEIEANVRRLETQIDQTIIRAPVDGLVTRRDAHIGDISSAGKVMFLMARDNRLELKALVPESDLKVIKPGNTVSIDSSFTGKRQVSGTVREISPLIDSESRLATARIDVPNNCGLKAGMYAEGHINVGKFSALTIPSKAVVSRDEKSSVFVLHHDSVESRQIIIGNRDSDFVQVTSGINEKEPIVIDGAGFLKDGDCVAVSNKPGSL